MQLGEGINIKKIDAEAIALLIFIFTFIYLGLANFMGSSLSHDMPYAYLASDSFLHYSIAEYSLEQGRFKYSPPYNVGGHEKVLEAHPPYLASFTILLSEASGLPVYDTIYMTALLVTLSGLLVFYIINRSYSKTVALLSLPLGLLLFSRLFNMMLFWGIWYFATGVAFMAGAAYFIPKITERKSFIFFGIIYGALILAHIPEAIFLAGFIGVYLAIEIVIHKKFPLDKVKLLALGGIIGALLTSFYINVFSHSFLMTEGFRGTPSNGYFGFPDVPITSLGIFGLVFIAGFILNIMGKKKLDYPVLFSIFCFGLSYLTYLGFGKRAFTHRFFWHIYLGIFFGIAVLWIAKLAIKKWNSLYSLAIFIIVIAMIAPSLDASTKVGNGIMDQYNWEGLKWIENNVPKDVPVFYFYSDTLSQSAALYSSSHTSFKIGRGNLTGAIQSGKLYDSYNFGLADAQGALVCEISPFSLGYYRTAYRPDSLDYSCEKGYEKLVPSPSRFWLCDIGYAYFNKASADQISAAYSVEVAKMMMAAPWIRPVFNNDLVFILHNEKPGEDCIGINSTG